MLFPLPKRDFVILSGIASDTASLEDLRTALRCSMAAHLAAPDSKEETAFLVATLAVLCGKLKREEIMATEDLREFMLLACKRAMEGIEEQQTRGQSTPRTTFDDIWKHLKPKGWR